MPPKQPAKNEEDADYRIFYLVNFLLNYEKSNPTTYFISSYFMIFYAKIYTHIIDTKIIVKFMHQYVNPQGRIPNLEGLFLLPLIIVRISMRKSTVNILHNFYFGNLSFSYRSISSKISFFLSSVYFYSRPSSFFYSI